MTNDTRELVAMFLPIAWGVVATGIALTLYKTGKAILESENKTDSGYRKVVLGGSAGIAAVAFLGFQYGTAHLMVPEGELMIDATQLHETQELATKADDKAVDVLVMCTERDNPTDCNKHVGELQNQTSELRAKLVALDHATKNR